MNYVDLYSDLYDPVFPGSTLDDRIELQLAGVWTDISTKVYWRDGVTITRGHPDETSRANPSIATLTLDDRTGAFAPRNPNGAYYGLLGRNTPMRISLPHNSTYLRLEDDTTSFVSCPDKPALDITGDIDIRVDLALSSYAGVTLAGKWNTLTDASWALSIDPGGLPVLEYLDSGGTDHRDPGSAPIPLGRIAIRAALQVNVGGNRVVTFYTAPTLAGPWTQLGSALTLSGAILLHTTAAPLKVGSCAAYASSEGLPYTGATGKLYGFQLLSGVGGTTVANPVFTAQTPGTAAFTDAQANLWSFAGTAAISDRKYRFYGEVPAWPPRRDISNKDIYTPLQASGLLRRIGQGTPPALSAMRRAYVRLTGTGAPVAYWPCEDATGSTSFASGLPSGTPMRFSGSPSFAADSSFACSQPLPTVNGSGWTGELPGYAPPAGAANVLRFLLKVPSSAPPTAGTVLASLFTSGTVARADLIYQTGGALQLKGYDATGTSIFDTGAVTFNMLDTPLRASVELQTSGANVQYSIVILAVGAAAAASSTGTVAGTIGNSYRVVIAPSGGVTQSVIGHVSVQPAWNSLFDLYSPLNAWVGEAAGSRFARLCREEAVGARVYGLASDTVAMGAQTVMAVPSLLQECEDADKGLIYEARQALALAYRTRVSMFNQGAALALSFSGAQLSEPFDPVDDDLLTLNDMTASRTGGSSSRQSLTSGALSTLAPPGGVGPYASGVTVSVAADGQLADEAGWLVHLGTVDDLRYPRIGVDLARTELAAQYYAAQDADIGDRVTVSGTPADLPPDGVSQIVRGMTEVCFTYTHTESWVCAPEAPYRVGIYDDPVLGRYDTDGSTLQLGVSSSAGTLLVATTGANSPLWTTAAGDFPFDIAVGGERMTVTNITGASSPQTFSVTRSVNNVIKAQTMGTSVSLFQPAVYSM